MPPPPVTPGHPDSLASICSSLVEQLVEDHIFAQLQPLHRAHKLTQQKCPQHSTQTHGFIHERGKDCFGKTTKPTNDANGMLFACTYCPRKIGAGGWTRHLAKCMGIAGRGRNKNGGASTLNSPMYKELSSDDESYGPSLFAPDVPSAHASQSPPRDDDEFTPTSTGSTSKKGIPKKRKKDAEKPPKQRKPRAPKNPIDSPSKTHVNRFKRNLGEMERTVSESPLAGSGGSSMARSRSEGSFQPPARKKPRVADV